MENLKLRKYQLELAENALKGDNTIICAETGTGKTWVALHIVKKHLERLQNGKLLCLPPSGSGDILFFPGRPSVCLSVRPSVRLSVTNRVRSIT